MSEIYKDIQFVDNLIVAITGNKISSYKQDFQPKLIQNCLKAYTNYVLKFIQDKYSESDSMRIYAALKYQNDAFTKFPGLQAKYNEAHLSFINNLPK